MRRQSKRFPLLLPALGALATLAPARAHAAAGEPLRVHALVGARVVVAPGRVLPRATIVVRDGVIEAVGADLQPPGDARIWDAGGRTVYAGFLEPWLPI